MEVKGEVEIIQRDLRDLVIKRSLVKNLHVLAGRRALRDLIGYPQLGGPGFTPDYIALGTDNTAPDDSQNALVAEFFRKQITRKVPGESGSDTEVLYQLFVATTEANGSGSVTYKESGLMQSASGGTMWARVKFTDFVKSAATSLTVNWKLIIKP